MAQNVENRQRVIFISNATENFWDGVDNLQSLSKTFPNIVFFTDDYDPEHKYSNGHRVNIWKGGQKYIKVHGLKQNPSVNLGNGITITLTLSDNGLLGLSIVSFINNLITLGAVPYNCTSINSKGNAITDAQISVQGENSQGFYSKTGTGSNTKYYISSNVNKIALYLAIQKGSEGEIDPSISIYNANDLNDKDENIQSVLNPSNQISGKRIADLVSLKRDLGLLNSINVSSVLRYSDTDIDKMLNNSTDPYNSATSSLPDYEIYKYDIEITKLFTGSSINAFPTLIKSSEVSVKLQDTNSESFDDVSILDLSFNSINFEPFFNEIVTTKDQSSSNAGVTTTKVRIVPCVSSPSNNGVNVLESDFDTYYNKIFSKYNNANFGIKLQIYAYVNGARINTAIDIDELNRLYVTVCQELGVEANPEGCLSISSINEPISTTPYYTADLTIRNFCDKTIERYLKDKGTNVAGPITSIYVMGIAYETGIKSQKLPISNDFIDNKDYLNYNYTYSTGFVLDVSASAFRVGIFVTDTESDNGNKLNIDFIGTINNTFNNNSTPYVFSVTSFNDFTSGNDTVSGGRLVDLSKHCINGSHTAGWVYIAIPKIFNIKPANQKFNNTLISNNISYKVATDDLNNPKTAYFSVIPEEFKDTDLQFDGYEYDVLKVKAPLTGSILLLNNNDRKIISNV